MMGNFKWILVYIFCAFAGILTGCGISYLTRQQNMEFNKSTKDNTLVRESGDSVFFDEEKKEVTEGENSSEAEELERMFQIAATIYPEPTPIIILEPKKAPMEKAETEIKETEQGQVLPTGTPVPTITSEPEVPLSLSEALKGKKTLQEEISNAVLRETIEEPSGQLADSVVVSQEEVSVEDAAQVITYPAEIFGQVPRVNQTDAYVTYFEFALNLVEAIQPLVKAKGLSEPALCAEFVVKALVYGVDVQKLDINDPISRAEAALVLWLAAGILDEPGSATSAKSAEGYVTDIGSCSGAEKRSVAYLCEQGFLSGYELNGQRFYPEENLETEDGNRWLRTVKQCWK